MNKSATSSKAIQYLFLVIMVLSSLLAMHMRPTHHTSEDREKFSFEQILPESFGDWKIKPNSSGHIINPQAEQNLNNIYSQTVSRTYVNTSNDEVIMLSVAYGDEQSDTKRLHYPDSCYPAQGFKIKSSNISKVNTPYGSIKVKQLLAQMSTRLEPITYWSTVGNTVVLSEHEGKIERLKYGLQGTVPDGILFRVSSIDANKDNAYIVHKRFINSLFSSLSNETRYMLAGLKAPDKEAI